MAFDASLIKNVVVLPKSLTDHGFIDFEFNKEKRITELIHSDGSAKPFTIEELMSLIRAEHLSQ